MKTYRKLSAALMACMMVMSSISFTACNDDDDEFSTNQYTGGVKLNVFGPCPVARGGELRFLGSGMDQVNSITLPGAGEISDIKVVSNEEIRITVPQNAEVGKVILHTSKGDITTLTDITYSEPISLESVAPLTVKAGNTITLTGDYLNLIHEVIFANEVIVPETEFASHTRYEIKLTVPAEAQSGKVIISDAAEIPNWIYSEEDLTVTLPSVIKVQDLTDAKPGDVIKIAGKDLDLVKQVVMPNEDEVEFKIEESNIVFTLPANVSNGTVCMIPASGVKVAIATIGVALPEDVEAVPATGLWAGDVLTLKGVNMEVVTSVVFPNVADAVEPATKSATELTVKVPEGTQSGNVILNTGSGLTVEVPVVTLQPENVAYNPQVASLAGQLTVNGKNLQNVKTIIFAGNTNVDVTNPTGTSFSVIVPATLPAGENTVAVVMTNDETVELPAIELSAPECAYATVLPGEEDEVKAGSLLVLTVANGDKLTDVKVNNASVQYILNGETLYVSIPATVGKSSKVTLVSSNGEISYDITTIPMTHVEKVIFQEIRDLGSWTGEADGGAFRIYKESLEGVPAGATMTFHIAPYQGFQIQLNNANWTTFNMIEVWDGWEDLKTVSIELTPEILANIMGTDDGWSTTAMVIQGQGTIISKVTLEWENALETTIWEGNEDLANWGINYEVKPNTAFADAGLKAGQTMRIYLDVYGADPKIQLFDGHWGGLVFDEVGDNEGGKSQFNSTNWPNMSCIEVKITPETAEKFTSTCIDWGYCLIVQGADAKLTKITIE